MKLVEKMRKLVTEHDDSIDLEMVLLCIEGNAKKGLNSFWFASNFSTEIVEYLEKEGFTVNFRLGNFNGKPGTEVFW